MALAVTLVFLAATVARQPAAVPPIERAGTPDAPRTVTVVMRDHVFVPSELRLIPGETVSLSVLNGGLVPHELALGDASFHAAWSAAYAAASPPAAFATPPPASVSPDIAPRGVRTLLGSGAQQTVTYVVPDGGAGLSMVCHLPGHEARGMVARVITVALDR
jgi:uncharacterized cupredoxin-like copper-binding protein